MKITAVAPNPDYRDSFAKTIPKSLFRMVSRKILDFSERRTRRSA